MQVTDIDSGTSLSIQALEQRVSFFSLQKKNASEEHVQYSERCETWTRELNSITEP